MSNLLTVEEVAARLQLSEYRVYELTRQGAMPHVKIGRLIRFTEAQIEEFVDGLCQKASWKMGR